ncbi:MAG: hypothetical protein FWE95_10590 [Planctomycetaceae bacterium]|nr:hypothetical protein [Planctomycetaceae bacterium]
MDRYPRCIKWLVLALALLHTTAGGHLVCHVHSHLSRLDQQQRHCDHNRSLGIQQATCCQDCPYNYKHICNEQLAVRTLRTVDEAEKLVSVSPVPCVSFVPVMYPPVLPDTVADYSSVRSLRLHLFYGVLLI